MASLFFLCLIFIAGFAAVFNDPKRHFLFAMSLSIYFVYTFLGPLNSLVNDDYTKFGGNYFDYFEDGLFLYQLAMLTFVGGYLYTYHFAQVLTDRRFTYVLKKKFNVYLFGLFLVVSFVVISGSAANASESSLAYNYLLFFADSLIVALTIVYFERKTSGVFWVLLIVTILFYLFLGFRYRIILMIIGFLYHLVMGGKLKATVVAKWGLYLYIISFVINFISINRHAFKNRDFSEVTFTSDSPRELSGYQYFLAETNNYSTDFNVLKYMRENNIDPDYGETIVYNVFVRVIPSSFFDLGVKPVAPQQEIIRQSFGSSEGYYAGAAVTNIFAYFIGFGGIGVAFLMGFLGVTLAYFSKNLDLTIVRNRIFVVVIAMILFQEITRGFMPQTVTLTIYLFLTLLLFYKRVPAAIVYLNLKNKK